MTDGRCRVPDCIAAGVREADDLGCIALHAPVMVCALHGDSGAVVVGHDPHGNPHVHLDLGRLRYSASSRRGRFFRAVLRGTGAADRG